MSHTAPMPTDDLPAPSVRHILRVVRQADVVYLAFPRVLEALLFDLRKGEHAFPHVASVRYETTADAQLAAIAALRRGPATIRQLVSVPWGGSTRAFVEQGVLPALLERLPAAITDQAMAAVEEVRVVERALGDKPPQRAVVRDGAR